MRRNPYVEVDGNLYHGTTLENLPGIVRSGLRPSGGVSRHSTGTKEALFLTDSFSGAMGYAASMGGVEQGAFVVLEIDTDGLPLEPDYDDVGAYIETDLEELRNELEHQGEWEYPDLNLGDKLGGTFADSVYDAIESMLEGGERGVPFTIGIDGNNTLIANPFTLQPIDGSFVREFSFLYDDDSDLTFDDGVPYLLISQYMCFCSVPAEKIVRVWIDATTATSLGLSVSGAKCEVKTYYGDIPLPEDWPDDFSDLDYEEQEELEGSVDFAKIEMCPYTISELRTRAR